VGVGAGAGMGLLVQILGLNLVGCNDKFHLSIGLRKQRMQIRLHDKGQMTWCVFLVLVCHLNVVLAH
jgi:hypothetical protein